MNEIQEAFESVIHRIDFPRIGTAIGVGFLIALIIALFLGLVGAVLWAIIAIFGESASIPIMLFLITWALGGVIAYITD